VARLVWIVVDLTEVSRVATAESAGMLQLMDHHATLVTGSAVAHWHHYHNKSAPAVAHAALILHAERVWGIGEHPQQPGGRAVLRVPRMGQDHHAESSRSALLSSAHRLPLSRIASGAPR
jgi:hypothetical protein